MNDYFKDYHPIINFTYFVIVIGFSMFLMHPIYMLISLSACCIYSVYLKGIHALKFNVLYMLPTLFIVSIINPMFNHQGATILFYLPSGNPFTLESVLYGIATGVMLITVIIWFSCYNIIMSSDKITYIFGKITPKLSLIFMMVLRFVPLYKERITKIINAQSNLECVNSNPSFKQKIQNSTKILSIMTSWSLENAIETADSMKARGYGLSGRTAFSNYKITIRDKFIGIYFFVSTFFLIFHSFNNNIKVSYFPVMTYSYGNFIDFLNYGLFTILCFTPIIINITEEIKWKFLISKI
ncbi:MAG: hypothetical protein ATN36_03615 [Epulopiscium sp. Nele67-Bin005]|nr:MAG: hypothetical protein ATN36_03615 [Epulopiscium sp. Nele67-Bin005]